MHTSDVSASQVPPVTLMMSLPAAATSIEVRR